MKKWRYLLIASILIFTLGCGLVDMAKKVVDLGTEPETAETVDDVAVVDDDAEHEVDVDNEDDASHVEEDDAAMDESSDEPSDDDALSLDDNALDMLDSYRVRIHWEVSYADGSGEVMDMEMSVTGDPEAYQYLMSVEGEEIEMIQVEDSMWMRFGDDWIASTADEMGSDDFGDFLISSDDMDFESWSEDDYKYLGKETVNGVDTKHYQAEYNEFWASFAADADVEDIEDAVADFWVANEKDLPNFVVKMTMTVMGTLGDQEGEWTIEQEVYDINESFTIDAPEGVAAGFPEDIPEYPGAEEFASFGGLITFATADTVEDVAEFYADELEANGWSEDENNALGAMMMATYSKDDRTLTLTITEEDSGSSVLIMVE